MTGLPRQVEPGHLWFRDTCPEDADCLPELDVLAQEIAEDLQAAMELFTTIAKELKE